MSYAALSATALAAATHVEYAGSYAKIAAVTLLPAILGGVVGYKALSDHRGVGVAVGVVLLPILTLLAVNAMPGGVARFVAP